VIEMKMPGFTSRRQRSELGIAIALRPVTSGSLEIVLFLVYIGRPDLFAARHLPQSPQTFRFTQLDAVWPNTTVVAMKGPRQQVVEIQSHSASLPVDEHSGEKNCCVMPKFQGCEPNGRLRAIA